MTIARMAPSQPLCWSWTVQASWWIACRSLQDARDEFTSTPHSGISWLWLTGARRWLATVVQHFLFVGIATATALDAVLRRV